jgi:GH25 family lysozyme M1 (1,4-beta-N-acetylmuramidase)
MFPDISEHQGVVDWNALGAAFAAGQIEAVSMRAGFGTVRADFQFARNQSECRARGIPAIFYWFNYPTFNSPQAEAAMFTRAVGPLQQNEAMMGDFEDDAPASIFPRGQPGVDWARAFLSALPAPQNATWFYTYTSLFNEVGMSPLLATWPFVWADYSARQDDPFGAIARQFTDCGSTPGVVGCCDQNRVLKAPLSQWLTGGHMPLDQNDLNAIKGLLDAGTGAGQPDWAHTNQAILATVQQNQNLIGTANAKLDALRVQIGNLQVPPASLQPVLDAIVALKADLDSLTLKKM